MGLTIHYTLSVRRRLYLEEVKALLDPLRAEARELGFAEVGRWVKVEPDCPGVYHWPQGAKKVSDLVSPIEGWLFQAMPGDGCESVRIGLCRFAGVSGWRLESFCKTQYASRHGWEHFLKCHSGVVELLWAAEKLGVKVVAKDEGELWETGSHARLRRRLAEYDSAMAALAGALKDADALGKNAACPILEHPQFERLEAEGVASHGAMARKAARVVKAMVRGD